MGKKVIGTKNYSQKYELFYLFCPFLLKHGHESIAENIRQPKGEANLI